MVKLRQYCPLCGRRVPEGHHCLEAGGEEEEEEEEEEEQRNENEEEEEGDEQPHLRTRETHFRGDYTRHGYSIPARVRANPLAFLSLYFLFFVNEIRRLFQETNSTSLRIYPEMSLEMQRQNLLDEGVESETVNHHVVIQSVTITAEEIESLVRSWLDQFATRLETVMEECPGSGFILTGITSFSIVFLAQRLAQVLGCYVPFPLSVRGKCATFNPTGKDNGCLLRCLAAFKLRKFKLSWRVIVRRVKSIENCRRILNVGDEITLPVPWTGTEMNRLEQKTGFSIYVYSLYQEGKKYYVSLARKGGRKGGPHVPILILRNRHATLIKQFDKFIRRFTRTKSREKIYCFTCLRPLPKGASRDHDGCLGAQTMSFPESTEKKIKFRNVHHVYPPSHIGFFDIETIQAPAVGRSDSVQNIHIPFAICYMIVDSEGKVVDDFHYVGTDAINVFIRKVSESWARIRDAIPSYPIRMTQEKERLFQEATECQICKRTFSDLVPKVRHHSHRKEDDNFISALCFRCNLLSVNRRRQIRFFSHNLSYDGGLILRYLSSKSHNIKIHSRESGLKLLKLEVDDLLFLDSLALMPGSLSELSKNHIKAGKPIPLTQRLLNQYPPPARPLMLGKQLLCYDYINQMKKLEDTCLPPRECFYNRLKDSMPTQEEYDHAVELFSLSGCQSLKDYVLLYLKLDVTLLADTFLNWRETLRNIHSVDVAFYLTLPSFAFDCFLRESKVALDPIIDPELYNILRQNLRGGFVTAVKQFASSTEAGEQLLYFDFNSLYSQCMTMPLPIGNIRKLTQDEVRKKFTAESLLTLSPGETLGYWLVVDTKQVRESVAQYTDDLPLALNHHKITEDMLSSYSLNVAKREGRGKISPVTKLIASHLPQRDYFISLKNLQMLMKLGLEIEKIHSVYEFSQECYLKDFILKNIEQRRRASCPITALSFKLINNAIYGKCLMDLSRYSLTFTYCNTKSKFIKLMQNPFMTSVTPFAKNRVLVTSRKPVLYINQATYVGFAILEHAKYIMYHNYYNVLKRAYQDKLSLIYSDTDSFILKLIKCEDMNEEYKREPLSELVDFSNFPMTHSLFDNSKTGKLGLIKSEVSDREITEVIALQAKSYSVQLADHSNIKRLKGIPRGKQTVVEHEDYRRILQQQIYPGEKKCEYYTIRNVKGEIITSKIKKTLLSAYDDKRYVVSPDKSYAFGHPSIHYDT